MERMMNVQTPVMADLELRTTADLYAHELGELLLQIPEYQAFVKALTGVNKDPAVQKISLSRRSHQNALRWFQGDADMHEDALAHLEAELELIPVVQDYHLAEQDLRRIFTEVDAVISQAAGIPFAINARRSGCGCGG
jgi:cell fate (sporulation/competence/biofilm development) regulator YlbF (YheA/YmcA/DUF963 family)